MTLYTYGGGPEDVVTDAAGNAIPDYPIAVRVAGTGELITALFEDDGTTPIGQLATNSASSPAPGAIRTFKIDGIQAIDFEHLDASGNPVRWYATGREVPIEASQAAATASTAAATAASQAATALTTANNANATANTAATAASAAQTAASTAQTDAAAAIAAVTSRLPPAATVDDLPAIVLDAHRGGAGEAPENTLTALRGAMAVADVLDLDSQVLGDGAPALMHDATVDRTTNASGAVTLFNTQQWGLIRADPSTWFAANAPALPLHTVEQVLDELGGRRVMTVEAKTSAGVAPLAAMILARRLERSVLINTNDPAVVPTITAAGCLAHLWRSAAQMATDDPATIRATGASLLDLDINGTDAQISAAVAQDYDLGVWVHTLTRRKQRDRALSLGCRGVITDYPGYVGGRVDRRTTSSFSTGQWGYGYVPSAAARPVLDASGRIPLPPPASSSASDAVVLLAGEVSPASAQTTVDVKFSVPTAGSTGWSLLDVHLGADDDATVLSSSAVLHNGYTCQVTNNSSLRIFRDDVASGGSSTQLANTATGATLAAGTVYTLRIVLTATQITLSIVEVAGLTVTVTDSTYRVPWYVFVGRNYNASALGLINILSITAT